MHLSADDYIRLVTITSAWISLVALWMSGMMASRMISTRDLAGPDVAALLYVASTVAVFGVIALRYGSKTSMWIVVVILVAKALGVTGIALWMYLRMRKERL